VMEAFVANPNAQLVQAEQQLLATPTREIPSGVVPRADDTLNFFGGHLESRVTARPTVRRRKTNKHWQLITSIVTAVLLLGTVLYALSRKDGVNKKNGENDGKNSAPVDDDDPKSNALKNLLATDDDKKNARVTPKESASPEVKVAYWAIQTANSVMIRVDGKSKQLVDVSDIPKTEFTVVSIDLSGIQTLRTRDFDMLADGAGLRSLNLNGADIGDIHLPHIAKLGRLSSLDLSRTSVTDRGVRQLESLSHLTNLQLSYTSVSDDGVTSLSKLNRIAKLDLTGSNVTDSAVETLADLSSLMKLGISDTKITSGGHARLKAKLPDCQITF
jgi:hypothetical protein